MGDIFISYASEDVERASVFARCFAELGWTSLPFMARAPVESALRACLERLLLIGYHAASTSNNLLIHSEAVARRYVAP